MKSLRFEGLTLHGIPHVDLNIVVGFDRDIVDFGVKVARVDSALSILRKIT